MLHFVSIFAVTPKKDRGCKWYTDEENEIYERAAIYETLGQDETLEEEQNQQETDCVPWAKSPQSIKRESTCEPIADEDESVRVYGQDARPVGD